MLRIVTNDIPFKRLTKQRNINSRETKINLRQSGECHRQE